MSLQQSRDLIENYITTIKIANQRKFSSSAQQLAYERGLLTGLIASLIDTDTYVEFVIKKKIDAHEAKLHQSKK